MFELINEKITAEKIDHLAHFDVANMIVVTRAQGKSSPALREFALSKFLEHNAVQMNYDNIRNFRICVENKSYNPDEAVRDAQLEQVVDAIGKFDTKSQRLNCEQILGLLEFPETEKRNALIDAKIASIVPEDMVRDHKIELIKTYMGSSSGDDRSRVFIEKIANGLVQDTEEFSRLTLTDMYALDIAISQSRHHKTCWVRQNLAPLIQEKLDSPTMW